MSEANKTVVFLALAVATVGLAVATRPATQRFDVKTMVGQTLVDDFALDAPKRLTITRVDNETGERRDFDVAEQKGLWTIPSKSGYPADATEQMVNAVEGVVGRDILFVAADQPGRHAEFGVLDPVTSADSAEEDAIGTRVKLFDKDEKVLADLIIGKEVKDSDAKQRYVRKASQDAVYVVEMDPKSFSTDFSDWIEKDLLGLNPFDVQSIDINDYSASLEIVIDGGRLRPILTEEQRAKMKLSFDDESSKWSADRLESYDKTAKAYQPFTLGENEELNEDALRELKNALDDLKIVDVERKPEGLSADLKAGGDFLTKQETVESLAKRGFLAVGGQDGGIELISSDGELVVTQKNGVEYVLRFGELQEGGEAAAGEQPATEATEAAAEKPAGGDEALNRYLFVLARFNEAAIERPKLEELPPLPDGADAANTEADSEEKPADDTSTDETATDDAAEAANEESSDDATTDEESSEESADQDAEEPAATDSVEPADKPASEDEVAKIREERKAIEDRNAEALKRYEEQLAEGRKRVDELNLRFGDWYYVIANDVFRKVHLGRPEVIKAKEASAAEGDAAAAPAAPFGAAGGTIPGLPNIPTGDASAADPAAPADEAPAASDEPASDEPASDEPAAEEPAAASPNAEDESPTDAAESTGAAPEAEAADTEEPAPPQE